MWQARLFKAIDRAVDTVRIVIPQLRGGIGRILLVGGVAGLFLAYVNPQLLWLVPLWVSAAIVIKMAAAETTVDWLKNTIRGGVVLLAAAIMLPNLPAYGPSGPALPLPGQWQKKQDARDCSSNTALHSYGTNFEVVNPGGQCRIGLWFKGHCIYVRTVRSTLEQGPYCGRGTYLTLPNDIESVRSGDAPFVDYIQLLPPLRGPF